MSRMRYECAPQLDFLKLGDELREVRKLLGLTAKKVSAVLGCRDWNILRIELAFDVAHRDTPSNAFLSAYAIRYAFWIRNELEDEKQLTRYDISKLFPTIYTFTSYVERGVGLTYDGGCFDGEEIY